MPLYEHVFIARPDVSQQQVETLTDTYKSLIESQGGSVGKVEYWGLRNLTYRIKKNRKGHYSLMNIDAPAAAVHEMERQMRINEDILRYLTVRVEEHDPNPSAVLSRGGREERGRDDRGRDDRGPRRGGGGGRFRDDRGPSRGDGADNISDDGDK
jgi:small subunit ribosomal protein S6